MKRIWNLGDIFPGGYEIHNILDSGGMGTVYIVQHIDSKRILAAKTYKAQFFDQPPAVRRFEFEAEMWIKAGNHPHIVFAELVTNIEGIPYIFLEYVPRGNLRELLFKKVPLSQALSFSIQSCEGLDFLHNKELENNNIGIIHCDLKPENILVAEGNILKITDFGLVKTIENSTRLMPVAGTPSYMSPEHFHGLNKVTKLSDIYSFGIILFEMLTGNLPFLPRGNTAEEKIRDLARQHHEAAPLKPSSLVQDIPAELDDVVSACLKKKPNDRIHSFQELKESLSQMYQNVTGAAYEPITDKSIKELDHIRLARSFNNLGKQHQAIEECDKALSLKLDSDQKVDVLNIKGLALFYLENYQDSLNCFDYALKIDSESSITWSNRGLALKELNKLEEAIQNYDKAIQLDPDDWGPYHNKGVALDTMGHREESLEWFKQALSVNPRHVNSLASTGNVLQKLERYDEAIKYELEALSINPRDPTAINNLVVIYLRLEKYQEALKWSDRLIELDLRYPYYWFNKATVLLKMEEFDLAIQTIEDGFEKADDKVRLLELKIGILLEIVKIRAEPQYHRLLHDTAMKILELNPSHPLAKHYKEELEIIRTHDAADDAKELDRKGEHLLNIGSVDEAIPYFEKAMELDPNFMSPYCNMGLVMELKGQKDRAMSYYNKAIELDPNHHMPWYNKGNCFKDKGNIKGALELYTRAAELNPGFINIWIAIGYCYHQLGNKEQALRALYRAREIEPNNPMVEQNILIVEMTL
jgi:serine/threonine protein kinase